MDIYPDRSATEGDMTGPCAKRTVICTIVTPTGEKIVGENLCNNPQEVCPRTDNEGYEKCRVICNQAGHAEIVAIFNAGEKAKGSRAYIEGHSYACRECQKALFAAGVLSLTIGSPP